MYLSEPTLPPDFDDGDIGDALISLIVMVVSMGITILLLLIIGIIIVNVREGDETDIDSDYEDDDSDLENQPLLSSSDTTNNNSSELSTVADRFLSIFGFAKETGSVKKPKRKSSFIVKEEEANYLCKQFVIEKGFVGSNIFPNYNVFNNKKFTLDKYLHKLKLDMKNNQDNRESYANILLAVFNDDEKAAFEKEVYEKSSKEDIALYERLQEFEANNPAVVKEFNTMNNMKLKQRVHFRGIQSYQFLSSFKETLAPDNDTFLPSFIVNDKLNIQFTRHNNLSSSVMNLPMPKNNKDCCYFEAKVYSNNQDLEVQDTFSIGLVTIPYPYFVMPGYSNISIAYESTGDLMINKYRNDGVLPKLSNGDVVGFGYRYKSGLIFITYNGKKVMDIPNKHAIELFVSCGKKGNQSNLLLEFNIGQMGYVFIEANVRKYAFDANIEGTVGVPPSYQNKEKDRLIIPSVQVAEEKTPPPDY